MKKYFVFLSLATAALLSVSLFLSGNDARAAITVSGSIANMAPEQGSFSLRASTASYQVIISSSTKLTDSNGSIVTADLNDGMTVSVIGVKNTDGAIQAETITTTTKLFTGRIEDLNFTQLDDQFNAGYFDLVNSTGRTFTLIPRGAKLLDYNGPIKLEDLNNGMTVSIKGSGTLPQFIRAETITTTTKLFTGRIEDLNFTQLDDQFNAGYFDLVNSTGRTFTLIPRGAKLLDSNGPIKLEDLNNGMTVSIKGSGRSPQFNAGFFDLVNSTGRTFTLIPRGAKLLDSNGPIKLEDLNNGMTVSIKGSGTLPQFIRAETITTTTKLFTGRIEDLNFTQLDDQFNAGYFDLVNSTGRTFTLIPRGAKLLDSNGPIKL